MRRRSFSFTSSPTARYLRRIALGAFAATALGALAVPLAGAPVMVPAQAQEPARPAATGVLALLPQDSVTEHVVEIGRERLAYTATAGTFPLFNTGGERSAAIFYTAYVRKDADPATRPVTFVFNGGPGAASTYLHLGLAGPQVIDFGPDSDGSAARLVPNPDTWLAFTDLVMIDPVGAGWSRAATRDGEAAFWSVQADAQSVAKVIALYLAKNGRTASPQYLLGESYGGFRAAKVARTLQQDHGHFIRGIVMLSPLLDGALTFGADRHPFGAALQLPALAAAALDRAGQFTEERLAAAERFAVTEYLSTLAGSPPEGAAAEAFHARVAEITGLPVEEVARARGFVGGIYRRHMAGPGKVVSAYDAAFAAADPYPDSPSAHAPDPVLSGFTMALGGSFVGYARDVLDFRTDMTFNQLNRNTARRWDWGGGGRFRASAARDLRELLALSPGFSLLVAHGRSDVITPYTASRYVLDRLPPIGRPGRVTLRTYQGGHMFYFDPKARAAFTADAAAFYRGTGS